MRRCHRLVALAVALGVADAAHAAAPDSLGLLAVAGFAGPPPRLAAPRPLPAPPGFTIKLEGAASRGAAGDAVPTGRITAALDLRSDQPTPARVEATLIGAPHDVRGEFRALAGRARGLWAGVAMERDGASVLPGLGAWARRRNLLLGASISRYESIHRTFYYEGFDTLLIQRFRDQGVMRTAGRASLRWATRGLELEAGGGLALAGGGPWRWADARVTMWPLRPVAVYASASSSAPVVFDSPAAGGRAALGLRLDPWRATPERRAPAPRLECRVRSSGPGWHAVDVRARGAHSVELMGDFTDWSPRPLQPVGGERWRLEIMLPPGAHRIAIRIDGGEWLPPPGLPTALDEFGGAVGLLVVP